MKKILLLAVTALLGIGSAFTAKAQSAAIKTNLLYDATATVNLGFEVGIAPKWTFDLNGNYNGWKIDGRQIKHWMAQPEFRYWFCEKFNGNFIGIHAIGGQYDVGNMKHTFNFLGNHFDEAKDHKIKGWAVGAGISYGHTWMLAKHWNLEAEVGFGWMYMRYDKYSEPMGGEKIRRNAVHNYVGPTKLALNLVYVF